MQCFVCIQARLPFVLKHITSYNICSYMLPGRAMYVDVASNVIIASCYSCAYEFSHGITWVIQLNVVKDEMMWCYINIISFFSRRDE